MNNILRNFYNNQSEREAVKAFLIEMLKEIAVERAFAGEDTLGIQEANECVIKAFDNLEVAYGKIEVALETNSR